MKKYLALSIFMVMTLLILSLMAIQAVQAQDDPTPTPPATSPGEEQITQPGTYVGAVVSGEALRGYLLHIPPTYDPAVATPLVLSYHGFTGDPLQNQTGTGLSTKADEEGFIVVYPAGQRDPMGWYTQTDALEKGWLDDVQFTRDLLAKLQRQLNIDPRRIYLTGFSNGGGMIHRLACDLSDVVAAIAPVAGPHFQGDPCEITRPMPVLGVYGMLDRNAAFNGYYDLLQPIPEWAQDWADRNGCDATPLETIPAEKQIERRWNNCDGEVEVILYLYEQGGHAWPPGTTDMIWEFFEAHPLPAPEAESD